MPELRRQLPQGRRSSSRTGTASSGSRSRPRSSSSAASARRSCRPRPARATRPTTTSSCGAGAARSTRTACCRSSSATRSARSSDSQYCNPAYDKMYDDQLEAPTAEARKAILAQMQNLIYDKAVYDILYYDANLEAYRTDRFAGWQNQPADNGDAVLHLQHAAVHEADRRQERSRRPAPSAGRASGSPAASAHRRRRPPRPPAAPERRPPGRTPARPAAPDRVAALVAVVAVGLVRRAAGAPRQRQRTRTSEPGRPARRADPSTGASTSAADRPAR